MIKVNINVLRLDRNRIIEKTSKSGVKAKYVDLVLIDRPDDYGNDGFVVESVTKEERDQGVKGNIVGNWKELRKVDRPPAPQQSRGYAGPENDQEIPF
jgi:hypothetical protein